MFKILYVFKVVIKQKISLHTGVFLVIISLLKGNIIQCKVVTGRKPYI